MDRGGFFGVAVGGDGEPLRALAAYVGPPPTHLDYAGRLAAGQSIGSGQVEGAIKQLVNRRRKRTGARWLAEHVGPLRWWRWWTRPTGTRRGPLPPPEPPCQTPGAKIKWHTLRVGV